VKKREKHANDWAKGANRRAKDARKLVEDIAE
jgi:hypothetical protein